MSERRFVLADFTYMDREGILRLYDAGRRYRLSRVIAHAATKRDLVAKQRPESWVPPNMFQFPGRGISLTEILILVPIKGFIRSNPSTPACEMFIR